MSDGDLAAIRTRAEVGHRPFYPQAHSALLPIADFDWLLARVGELEAANTELCQQLEAAENAFDAYVKEN